MSPYPYFSAEELSDRLPFAELIEALRAQYRQGCTVPPRHHHTIGQSGEPDSTLLVMPAWDDEWLGLKSVTITPGNGDRGMPALLGTYLLYRKQTGQIVAIMDGAELTARRTAANSALAADYLAQRSASRMLMVGTGKLASYLPLAHAKVRNLERIDIWGRRPEEAIRLSKELSAQGLNARPVEDLEAACREADIVSCATLSREALVKGKWLKHAAHLDLVGAFRPEMREVDAQAIAQGWLVTDNVDSLFIESGDVMSAVKEGVIGTDCLKASLTELCRGEKQTPQDQRTIFKSLGWALQDLCAAKLAARATPQ